MSRLWNFVYGNFMTLFNKVVENLRELTTVQQLALALIGVALVFIAIMIFVYILRISRYRMAKNIENVDVVFFNTVYEFGPYKKAKEGQIVFLLVIPFTFVINLVIKVFMWRSFTAINSSDYITRRMLENMQLENMKLKDKQKELLKQIDEAGLNKRQRKVAKATPKQKAPAKKAEPKQVQPEPKKEEVKEEPKKVTPVKEEAVTSSTLVTEKDSEPEVILANPKVDEPKKKEKEIIDAEVIEAETDNIDELIEDVKLKETRGKA